MGRKGTTSGRGSVAILVATAIVAGAWVQPPSPGQQRPHHHGLARCR